MRVEFKEDVMCIHPESKHEENYIFDWYDKNKNKQLCCLVDINYWVHIVCPKCGDMGRCEPFTLDSPDGQECDCGINNNK